MQANPTMRHSPLLSPIGLEPVVNDPGPELAPQWPDLEVPVVPSADLRHEAS
jgi:hypothetical protein